MPGRILKPMDDFLHIKQAIRQLDQLRCRPPPWVSTTWVGPPSSSLFSTSSPLCRRTAPRRDHRGPAIRFGDVWGGLINATFGNVVEMILSIVLDEGLDTVVPLLMGASFPTSW